MTVGLSIQRSLCGYLGGAGLGLYTEESVWLSRGAGLGLYTEESVWLSRRGRSRGWPLSPVREADAHPNHNIKP